MKILYTLIFLVGTLLPAGCSGDKSNTSSQQNVFKTQTDAMKKAEQVEAEVLKQAQQQQQVIEQQTK